MRWTSALAHGSVARDGPDAASLSHHYLVRLEEETLKHRPLWIRVIVELIGTFILVTVAAGAGVINQFAGGNPVS